MKIRAIGIGAIGTLALLAGLHHIVVVTARSTAFSNTFAGSCHWCHGDAYDGFGTTIDGEPPSAERGASGEAAHSGATAMTARTRMHSVETEPTTLGGAGLVDGVAT